MGLTVGPHLPVTGTKEKGEGQCWAGGGSELGRCGPQARAWERPLSWELRGLKKKRGRGKGIGPAGKEGREGKKRLFSFSFKFFSNSFFKLSNFNQTEIHAFES
jgi:hypothetical protein